MSWQAPIMSWQAPPEVSLRVGMATGILLRALDPGNWDWSDHGRIEGLLEEAMYYLGRAKDELGPPPAAAAK